MAKSKRFMEVVQDLFPKTAIIPFALSLSEIFITVHASIRQGGLSTNGCVAIFIPHMLGSTTKQSDTRQDCFASLAMTKCGWQTIIKQYFKKSRNLLFYLIGGKSYE
jgi:hypothetical protein